MTQAAQKHRAHLGFGNEIFEGRYGLAISVRNICEAETGKVLAYVTSDDVAVEIVDALNATTHNTEIERKDELLAEAEYLLTQIFREGEQMRLSEKIRKELNNETD